MQYRRNREAGGTFFFTVVTEGRRPILVLHVDALREAFREVMASRPFRLEAAVVLPDHQHAIWTLPEGDDDYPVRWRRIKSLFSTRVPVSAEEPVTASRQAKGERGLWQRRFWEHTIRSEEEFERAVAYVHWNPVKHGLVQAPVDWPHSSFHRFVRAGLLPRDWGRGPMPAMEDLPTGE